MDRLRALEYFVAAAEQGSFSGASREFGVSVAAVAKQIGALEQHVGVVLFERGSKGLTLTASGEDYLEACRPALADLVQADEQLRAAASPQPRGTVVVGMPIVIAQECLTPALPTFHARHPELQLDLRSVQHVADPRAAGCDLLVLLGWPRDVGNLVHRTIALASMIVAASPSYWAQHGMPAHPRELEQHQCFALRGSTQTLVDLWQFQRGEETVTVPVRGFLVTDNSHRNVMLGAALAGCGVARMIDWNLLGGHELARGLLVQALADWESLDVPAVNLLYPPSVRRQPRVRAVIDFITQLFDDLQKRRGAPLRMTSAPAWAKSRYLRASTPRTVR